MAVTGSVRRGRADWRGGCAVAAGGPCGPRIRRKIPWARGLWVHISVRSRPGGRQVTGVPAHLAQITGRRSWGRCAPGPKIRGPGTREPAVPAGRTRRRLQAAIVTIAEICARAAKAPRSCVSAARNAGNWTRSHARTVTVTLPGVSSALGWPGAGSRPHAAQPRQPQPDSTCLTNPGAEPRDSLIWTRDP